MGVAAGCPVSAQMMRGVPRTEEGRVPRKSVSRLGRETHYFISKSWPGASGTTRTRVSHREHTAGKTELSQGRGRRLDGINLMTVVTRAGKEKSRLQGERRRCRPDLVGELEVSGDTGRCGGNLEKISRS